MVTFVLAAILILLATLALLVWPLLFTRNTFSYARQAQNIHYAKERLTELEEQLKNASISATDYEALKLEIETTLAQDIDLASSEAEENTALPRRPNKAAITALCVFIPLGSAAVYTAVGTPEALDGNVNVVASTPTSANAEQQPSAQEINQMVGNLEQRLAEAPDDMQGWALLSRTYLALGQYGKARDGLKKVLELGGETADIYASLADASALAESGNMAGEPTQYADKALSLNPNNRQALWLRGLAAVQSADKPTAQKHWGLLLTILADQPEQQAELRGIMSEALGEDSVALSAETSAASPQSVEKSTTIASNKDSDTSNSAPVSGVQVNISIAPEIQSKLDPQDLVFVFARAVNGPPPPLAVRRFRVADLPINITLSDQDAMVPQFKMSLFKDITVSARVSKSGQPVAQPGDYQSESIQAKPGQSENLVLNIANLIQ